MPTRPIVGPSAGASAWGTKFQRSPIYLRGGTGIATSGDIPITTYTDIDPNATEPFADYMPAPGSTLLRNQSSTMPFANQAIAANAIIKQPVNLSMLMICPIRGSGGKGWAYKLSIIDALCQTLDQHNNLGGLYNVMTPARTYIQGQMIELRDVSQGEVDQPQYKYQWDFFFPLISLEQAQAVLNTLLNKLSTQGAPNPSVPTVGTAIAAKGVGAPQLTQSLTQTLGPALSAAGLGTAQLPGVVGSSVQVALAGDFSPTDLASHLANSYLPATQALGMNPTSAFELFSSNVNIALNMLGVTPNLLQNMLKSSLGSVSIPGVNVNPQQAVPA